MLKKIGTGIGLFWFFGAFAYALYAQYERKVICIEQEGWIKGYFWCSTDSSMPPQAGFGAALTRGLLWPLDLFALLTSQNTNDQEQQSHSSPQPNGLDRIYFSDGTIGSIYNPADVKKLERYAEQGDSDAQLAVGNFYLYGVVFEKDYERARIWYFKSKEGGNAEGANNLGILYRHGLGVKVDYNKALSLFSEAANAGNVGARINLGIAYSKGEGTRQDYKKAYAWFHEAALQGDAQAQYIVGAMLIKGQGVERDAESGKNWIERAAHNGYEDAKQALERMR